MEKLYLAQYLNIFLTKDDLLCIGIPNTQKYIKVPKTPKSLKILEKLIFDGIEKKKILNNPLAKKLFEKKMLVNALKMDRKELFFDYLKIAFDKSIIEKFKILVFGAGAGGSSLSYLLAQFGFRNIKIIDDDLVEQSDMLKSCIFKKRYFGNNKVDALEKEIFENFDFTIEKGLNKPFTKKDIKFEIDSFKPDLIVKACDPDLMFRRNLNEICLETLVPYFSLSYSYENILIGPLIVPKITYCDKYLEEVIINTCGEHYSFDNINKLNYKNMIHPSISFNVNLLASLALKEIVFFCLKKHELVNSFGNLMIMNCISLEKKHILLYCDSKCKFCKQE